MFRLAFIVVAVVLLAAVGGSLRPGVSTAGATEVDLDTYRQNNSHPITATGPTLDNGTTYVITVTGTWSYWFAQDWQTYGTCAGSAPDDMPMFPSPGTTNGLVGDDAAWHFAGPQGGLSDCGTPPVEGPSLEVSLDDGSTFDDLQVIDPGTAPNPSHTYHMLVIGQGQGIAFRFYDEKTVDNYGIVKFTVQPFELTWGDNDCSGQITPADALETALHMAGVDPVIQSCPAIGQTLPTASFGERTWGDLDCSGQFDAPDILLILEDAAGLPPANLQDCPALGIIVALTDATPTATPPSNPVSVEVGKLADGDDDGGAFSNSETVSPGSQVTYLVTIDNDSDVPVTIESLVDDTYPDVDCETDQAGAAIGAALAPDDGDGPGVIDGGADEVQCTFVETAPGDAGVQVTDTVTATVTDGVGHDASDHDDATITTS